MDDDCSDPIQKKLEKLMPWVGGYIAGALAICTLAMAADAFNGLRSRKLWFPCKYFSLNATSLALLAVAMKLTMDLTTIMIHSKNDLAAKFSSMIFMSTAIGNFSTSLGSMNDKDILSNVVALAILVITIAVDVLIQLVPLWRKIFLPIYYVCYVILMLLCLAQLVSMAIAVPAVKRSLELKYQEKHKVALEEEGVVETRKAFTSVSKGYMMKHWVMAQTSNPQFVMARSVVSTTSAVICLVAVILLVTGYVKIQKAETGASPYGESTRWIFIVQIIGVTVGIIAPMSRFGYKCSTVTKQSLKKIFKIEAYWIQTLVDSRDSFSSFDIGGDGKYRKPLHGIKWFAISFCIGCQILIVLFSKLLVLIFSVLLMIPIIHIMKFVMKHIQGKAAHTTTDLHHMNLLNNYVLLLEDEAELPRTTLNVICGEVDQMILEGTKKQPKILEKFLSRPSELKFDGVRQFDSDQVASLHVSQEPPNCWTLPVVTLTSIVIALPNTSEEELELLLNSVSEGVSLAKLVDKTMDNQLAANTRKAADVCWVGVVLHKKWLKIDLKEMSLNCNNSKKVLEELSNKAEEIITAFKQEMKDADPLNWPPNVVAANSMYRICRTKLLSCEEEGLFEQLSTMIADILGACLTNLPHIITTMCHLNAIEKREKSVRKAFLLHGKTTEIIDLLQKKVWPEGLDYGKAASIEVWRASLLLGYQPSLAATSGDAVMIAPVSTGTEERTTEIEAIEDS